MNIALVIAGGTGNRMGQDIPKQFMHVAGKPIIIHTLEAFERHPDVHAVAVVCLAGWETVLRAYANQFCITKLKHIFPGGNTGQESIRNGVFGLKEHCDDDDIVIVHDGIRPFVDESVLSDVIVKAKIHGNAVTSLPYNEQIFIKENEESTRRYIPRETLRRVQTPQAYRFEKLHWAYRKAFAEKIGIHGSSYTNTMMTDLGETLYFAAGSEKNIKLTTLDDIALFKALLSTEPEKWLKK